MLLRMSSWSPHPVVHGTSFMQLLPADRFLNTSLERSKKCDVPYYEVFETEHLANFCLFTPRPEGRLCGACADAILGARGPDQLDQHCRRQLEHRGELEPKPGSQHPRHRDCYRPWRLHRDAGR